MNFKIKIATLLFFVLINESYSQSKINQTVNYYYGFGSFSPGYTSLSNDNKTIMNEKLKGLPSGWDNMIVSRVIVDYNQFYVQEYKNGKMSKQTMDEMVAAGWDFNEKLALQPESKCYFYVVSGKNSNGEQTMIVDSDNDLDFTNNLTITPLSIQADTATLIKTIIPVSIEKNSFGKKKTTDIPFLVVNFNGTLNYCIPFYSTTNIKINEKNYTFESAHRYLINGTFTNLQTRLNGLPKLYYKDDIIVIDSVGYKNIGIDYSTDSYSIEEIKDYKKQEVPSIGFMSPRFQENDLKNNIIALDKLRGKVVFIDFWATWCSPCIQELPKLKSVYDMADKSKIVFLGVAVDQKRDALDLFLKKNSVPWDIIISNKIADLYRVSSLPSNFLVDETGKVININISSDDLKVYLKKYIAK